MSDFSEMAEAALIHDIRAEQQQAHEHRAFADALESMIRKRDKAIHDSVQALATVLDRAMQKHEQAMRHGFQAMSAGIEQLNGETK